MQLSGDAGLEVRVPVKAGPRVVGVSFVREHVGAGRAAATAAARPRASRTTNSTWTTPTVGAVQIGGPYDASGPAADTPSQRRSFVCQPQARRATSRLRDDDPVAHGRLAYRRPVTKRDVRCADEFFDDGRRDGGSFDAGIQFALERMLVDPDFLLRVHRDPARTREGRTARQRSAFVPAERPRARVAAVVLPVEQHPGRPAARPGRARTADEAGGARDRKCGACWPTRAPSTRSSTDFAAQWLNLRRVDDVVVDPDVLSRITTTSLLRGVPDARPSCSSAARSREDRSVLGPAERRLHVRERTARAALRHPGRLRQPLPPRHAPRPNQRGGLLAQGALLATTSYPDRTSPVLRGKWLLEQHLRRRRSAAAAGREHRTSRTKPGAKPPTDSRAARAAPHATRACNSCHCGDRSARLRARELRRDRRMANRSTRRQAGGLRSGEHRRRRQRSTGCPDCARCCWRPEAVPAHGHREADGLRARPPAGVLRSTAVRQIVRDAGGQRLPLVLDRARDREEPGVPDGAPAPVAKAERSKETGDLMAFVPIERRCSRRTVLRGFGATLALPFLDAMLPAFSVRARAAKPVHRFQTFYVPNGMAMEYWTPKGEGRDFELSPILEPLAAYQRPDARAVGAQGELELHPRRRVGIVPHGHAARRRNEIEIIADISMDQMLARHFAKETQVALARALDGRAGQRRRLHRQPELRLHAHALVAERDAAAADGVEPARRCSRSCSATAAARTRRRARRGCSSTRASSTR